MAALAVAPLALALVGQALPIPRAGPLGAAAASALVALVGALAALAAL